MTEDIPTTRPPRSSVMLSAHIFRERVAVPSVHRIKNISETGVCLAQDGELTEGTVVVLSVGQADHVAADVKWVDCKLAGLAFREPVDLIRARMRRTDGGQPAIASGWLAELNHAHR